MRTGHSDTETKLQKLTQAPEREPPTGKAQKSIMPSAIEVALKVSDAKWTRDSWLNWRGRWLKGEEMTKSVESIRDGKQIKRILDAIYADAERRPNALRDPSKAWSKDVIKLFRRINAPKR